MNALSIFCRFYDSKDFSLFPWRGLVYTFLILSANINFVLFSLLFADVCPRASTKTELLLQLPDAFREQRRRDAIQSKSNNELSLLESEASHVSLIFFATFVPFYFSALILVERVRVLLAVPNFVVVVFFAAPQYMALLGSVLVSSPLRRAPKNYTITQRLLKSIVQLGWIKRKIDSFSDSNRFPMSNLSQQAF